MPKLKLKAPQPQVYQPLFGMKEVLRLQEHPFIQQQYPHTRQITYVPGWVLAEIRRPFTTNDGKS